MWGSFMSGFGQGMAKYGEARARAQELMMQKRMSQYNARLAILDAEAAQRKTDFGQIMQARDAASIMGSMEAGMGASGGQLNFAVLSSQWDELQLDNFLIGLEGRTEKTRFESEAKLHKMQARIYGRAATQAHFGGMVGMMLSMFGGGSSGGGGDGMGGTSTGYQGYRTGTEAGAGGTYADNTSGYGMGYGGYPGSYGGYSGEGGGYRRRNQVAILGN